METAAVSSVSCAPRAGRHMVDHRSFSRRSNPMHTSWRSFVVAKMGSRLKSEVSVAEVIVVKGSDAADEVFCAGVVMSAEGGDGSVPAVTEGEQVLLGK